MSPTYLTKSPGKEEPMKGILERGTPARAARLPASVSLVNGSYCRAAALSEPAQEEALGPKEAIRKVLAEGEAAWNRGDLHGAMVQYWSSPETTLFTGKDVTRGWQAILEYFQKGYHAEGKERGQLTSTWTEIDLLDPETAWLRGRWCFVFSEAKRLGGLATVIMKKTPDGWRIVHDHPSVG
jgi:beta-aspartyl-peptidase (threonine type)